MESLGRLMSTDFSGSFSSNEKHRCLLVSCSFSLRPLCAKNGLYVRCTRGDVRYAEIILRQARNLLLVQSADRTCNLLDFQQKSYGAFNRKKCLLLAINAEQTQRTLCRRRHITHSRYGRRSTATGRYKRKTVPTGPFCIYKTHAIRTVNRPV